MGMGQGEFVLALADQRTSCARMRILRLLLILLGAGGIVSGADEPTPATPAPPPPAFVQPIPELKLTNGVVFRRVTVVRYERDVVVLKSAGGLGPLLYSYIPQPLRSQMLAERERAKAALVAAAVAESAPPVPTVRTLTGEAFLGVGQGLGLRVGFPGMRITAYPLAEAEAAFAAGGTPSLPSPLAQATADGEGHWTMELPLRTPFLLHAKASFHAAKSGQGTDYEWRIPSTELDEDKVELTSGNALIAESELPASSAPMPAAKPIPRRK